MSRLNNHSLQTYIAASESELLRRHDVETNERGNLVGTWKEEDITVTIEFKPDGSLYWLLKNDNSVSSTLCRIEQIRDTARKNNVNELVTCGVA